MYLDESMSSKDLVNGSIRSRARFIDSLKSTLDELGISIKKFAEISGIPKGTLYKILSGKRDPRLSTYRQIVQTVENLENVGKENFIAIIAARPVLDAIRQRVIRIEKREFTIKEYPAATMEEAIISAVKANRDGAKSIVCAPIVSATIEKIVDIPVATVNPGERPLIDALKVAATKSV